VLAKIKRRFTAVELKQPYKRGRSPFTCSTGIERRYGCFCPTNSIRRPPKFVGELRDRDIDDVSDLIKRIQNLGRRGRTVHIYPDAEEFIQRQLLLNGIARRAAEIRRKPELHPLRRELLKAELLPYQLDGIAFAAGAGRPR
jgi:hypothetical protein